MSWQAWQAAGTHGGKRATALIWSFLIQTLLLRRLAFLQFSAGVLPSESLGGTKQQGHPVEAEDMVGRLMLCAGQCWSKWLEASGRCRQM